MKNTKRIFIDAIIYDYATIAGKLTDMAAQGWHLHKAGALGLWTFHRGEPKQVRYEIIYAPKASAFNARPTDAEEDLAELCAQAGWERVTTLAQMQVFRNENPNATPLETDESQKLLNIRKTMKKHFFPPYLLMTVLFLVQFLMHYSTLCTYPTQTLGSGLMIMVLLTMPTMSAAYLAMTLNGWLWLRRADRAVKQGEPIPENRFYRGFRWVLWGIVGMMLGSLLGMNDLQITGTVLGISAITLGGTLLTTSICKKLEAPKWVNISATMLVTFLLLTLFLTLVAIGRSEPQTPENEPLLTLQDLGVQDQTESAVLSEFSSPILSFVRFMDVGDDQRLGYSVTDVSWDWAWERCLNEQERDYLQTVSFRTDGTVRDCADLWNAEYARHAIGESAEYWFICWENRIVTLTVTTPLTDDQIAVVASLLAP